VIALDERRRFFSEEIAAVANLGTPGLVEAIASVPRERFLGPGPWTVLGEGGMGGQRRTADADPRHVYHNVAVAIDPERQLFNGAPTTVTLAIDALALRPGARVLHLGCGLGYYTALMAHCVGPAGRVVALEIDAALAEGAREALAEWPCVEVRHANGTEPLREAFDAVLVNAGVTHPRPDWLEAVTAEGRMVLPLTVAIPQMKTIGKGLMLLLTKGSDGSWAARMLTLIAIYSAIGLRDPEIEDALGKALTRLPMASLRRLRRDPHEAEPSCWLHTADLCLAT
jgi:protein-L-isoaspartate(D-aspartate) O-methyltransferase